MFTTGQAEEEEEMEEVGGEREERERERGRQTEAEEAATSDLSYNRGSRPGICRRSRRRDSRRRVK